MVIERTAFSGNSSDMRRLHSPRWSYLEIRTNPKEDDAVTAYAAGALEGALTRDLMLNNSLNLFGQYCKNNTKYCDKLEGYFSQQLQFMNQRSEDQRHQSPFWNQVYLMLKQMAGLENAYNNESLAIANRYEKVSPV